ncbi:MAG: hypothetical protein ACLQVK_13500 [Acidimicrobiales bacterium]
MPRTQVTSVNLGEVMCQLAERARRSPQPVGALFGAQGVKVAPFEPKAAMHLWT